MNMIIVRVYLHKETVAELRALAYQAMPWKALSNILFSIHPYVFCFTVL